jgi:hypothetical protein
VAEILLLFLRDVLADPAAAAAAHYGRLCERYCQHGVQQVRSRCKAGVNGGCGGAANWCERGASTWCEAIGLKMEL